MQIGQGLTAFLVGPPESGQAVIGRFWPNEDTANLAALWLAWWIFAGLLLDQGLEYRAFGSPPARSRRAVQRVR